VTISRLFGVEAVEHRLGISEARVLVTDRAGWQVVAPIRDRFPNLAHILIVDGASDDASDFCAPLSRATDRFANVATCSGRQPIGPGWRDS